MSNLLGVITKNYKLPAVVRRGPTVPGDNSRFRIGWQVRAARRWSPATIVVENNRRLVFFRPRRVFFRQSSRPRASLSRHWRQKTSLLRWNSSSAPSDGWRPSMVGSRGSERRQRAPKAERSFACAVTRSRHFEPQPVRTTSSPPASWHAQQPRRPLAGKAGAARPSVKISQPSTPDYESSESPPSLCMVLDVQATKDVFSATALTGGSGRAAEKVA